MRAALRPAGSASAPKIVVPQPGGGQLGAEVGREERVLEDAYVADAGGAGTEVKDSSGH